MLQADYACRESKTVSSAIKPEKVMSLEKFYHESTMKVLSLILSQHRPYMKKRNQRCKKKVKMEKTATMNPWGRLLRVMIWRMMMTIKAWLHHHPQLIRT